MMRWLALLVSAPLVASAAPDRSPATWTYAQVLAPPTRAEIANAERAWAAKRQRVTAIRETGRTRIELATVRYDVRLLSYILNGEQRCGAVLIPEGTPDTTVVDLSDVRFDYPPRDISRGPYLATVFGERAARAAILIPCFRGMTILVNGVSASAAGDRRDAWEGATEDARGFLTAALRALPQLPRENVAAYGYSRGGGVALLMGQRDRRIRRVAAFAAPVDFFAAMGRPGVDWAAALEAAQHNPALPADSRERQYLDWFIAERPSLAAIRRKLLMSSPGYFLHRLPPTQLHQGTADRAVPPDNARIVQNWASAHRARRVEVRFYEGAPHRLDNTDANQAARAFLLP